MSCSDTTPITSTPQAPATVAHDLAPAIAVTAPAPVAAMPRINEPAPAFSAKTTHGDRSLADYKANGWYSSPIRQTLPLSAPRNSSASPRLPKNSRR